LAIEEQRFNKKKLRLNKRESYWFDIIFGFFRLSTILIIIVQFILNESNFEFLIFPFSVSIFIFVSFILWNDDNLDKIYTGKTKEENLKLIKNCLTELNWQYNNKSKYIELTCNTYLLKCCSPSIFEEDNYIFFNFKYHSTKGRISFFFGISTFLNWKFKSKLKKLIKENKQVEK
jgi:hypothetical protein